MGRFNKKTKVEYTSILSLPILTAIFPCEPGLASFNEAKNYGSGAISRAKLQSNRHCQQNNTQLFTGCRPTNSDKVL